MAAQNLGEWDARPVGPGPDQPRLADDPFDEPAPDGSVGLEGRDLDRGPDDVRRQLTFDQGFDDLDVDVDDQQLDEHDDLDRDASPRIGSDRWFAGREPSFWLAVAVGLLPLVAVVSGIIGYLLGSRGGDDGDTALAADSIQAAGETAGASAATAAGPEASAEPAESGGSTVPAEGLPVETTAAPSSALSVAPQRLVASGLVANGTIELAGALPSSRQAQWSSEIADLATVLDLRLVDGTEVAELAGGGAELTLRFPEAVVYAPDSPTTFEGDPDPFFEAVAGVLNRGTAQLVIVAYGDPTDPDDGILALSRAGHVREHLLELGVDPTRLVVESRPPLEATAGTDPALVERRADLEFSYRS